MFNLKTIYILLCAYGLSVSANAQGLQFKNPANSIEKRTSYDVFNGHSVRFRHYLEISFDMQLPHKEEVGYVFRLIDRSCGEIFNLFFDRRGDDYFELNEEGHKSLLKIKFDRRKLMVKQWFKMQFFLDLQKKKLSLSVDGQKVVVSQKKLPDEFEPQIIFGRSDYLIDVPSFSMKNLLIRGEKKQYDFPLYQTHGNSVYTRDGRKLGNVINPYWSVNDTYHWKKCFSSFSKSPAGYCYHIGSHEVLYFNRDSLFIYNVMSETTQRMHFVPRCPLTFYLGTSFIDEQTSRLYAYEALREHKKPEEPSVASLDLKNYLWTVETNAQINEGQMHHHGAYYDAKNKQYTIYGGFANMRYNAQFYTYLVNGHRWMMRHDIKGQTFPRYFLSMGHDGGHYVYLFGGMGNESGNQTVGRRFFYDLHRLDTRTNRLVKLWDADWGKQINMVAVKGMVVRGGYFYTLCYSEFLSDSYLKLYRFSLKNGSYTQLGDSIPIHPDRIESEANLFYDPLLRQFVTTVQEFRNERYSVFRAYTINAPVLSEAEFKKADAFPSRTYGWWIAGLLVLVSAVSGRLFYKWRMRSGRKPLTTLVNTKGSPMDVKPNSVSLFGDFIVHDSHDRDITYMFTDKLKQIFCLLLAFSNKNGISSRYLGNIMWGEKTVEKIKNSRGVAMNHLRKVLDEMEGVKVVCRNNCFLLECTSPFYCDYLEMRRLIDEQEQEDDNDEAILQILRRGKFLSSIDAPVMDSMKSNMENRLLPVLKEMMLKAEREENYVKALECIRNIFNIDPVDEDAYGLQVKLLKKTGNDLEVMEAQIRYKEAYKKVYGKN